MEALEELGEDAGAGGGVALELHLLVLDGLREQILVEVGVDLHEAPHHVLCDPRCPRDINELPHFLLTGRLSQLKQSVVTQLHQNFQVFDEGLDVSGGDQNGALRLLALDLVVDEEGALK